MKGVGARSPECAVGEQELLQESERQAAISQLESMSCQEGSLYCQECMSYQEIEGCCKRERGLLRLQEMLRQVRFVRDCACCQMGWQGDAEDCRLEEGYVLPCGSPGEA